MRILNVGMVFDKDGLLDTDATMARCRAMCDEYRTEQSYAEEKIGSAVYSIFAKHPFAVHNRESVVFGVLRDLNADPVEVPTLKRLVNAWLSARTDTDGADTGKQFVSKRGKNGGILMRATNATPPDAVNHSPTAAVQ